MLRCPMAKTLQQLTRSEINEKIEKRKDRLIEGLCSVADPEKAIYVFDRSIFGSFVQRTLGNSSGGFITTLQDLLYAHAEIATGAFPALVNDRCAFPAPVRAETGNFIWHLKNKKDDPYKLIDFMYGGNAPLTHSRWANAAEVEVEMDLARTEIGTMIDYWIDNLSLMKLLNSKTYPTSHNKEERDALVASVLVHSTHDNIRDRSDHYGARKPKADNVDNDALILAETLRLTGVRDVDRVILATADMDLVRLYASWAKNPDDIGGANRLVDPEKLAIVFDSKKGSRTGLFSYEEILKGSYDASLFA